MVTVCIQPSADATGCESSRSRTMQELVAATRVDGPWGPWQPSQPPQPKLEVEEAFESTPASSRVSAS
eukprot:7100211-Prymnesium_polylepis.1